MNQAGVADSSRLVAGSAIDTLRDLAGVGSLAASFSTDRAKESAEQTLDWLRQALDLEASEIFLREPHGGDMLLAHFRGQFEAAFTQITRFRVGEGFPGLVLSRGTPVQTTDLAGDGRYLRTRVKNEGFRSYVCVPLRALDGIIGTLNVASRRSDLDIARTQRILQWVSVPLTGALETASLRARLDTLAAAVEKHPRGGIEDLLRHVLHRMISIAGAAAGELTLFHPGLEGPMHRVSEGAVDEASCAGTRRADILPCPALVGEHGIALYGPRSSWPPSCRHTLGESAVVHCVPLVSDSQPIGLIQLRYFAGGPSPPTRHLAVLLAAAKQATRVIEDARATSRYAPPIGGVPTDAPPVRDLQAGGGNGRRGLAASRERSRRPRWDSGPPLLDIRCFGSFELYRQGVLLPRDAIQRRGAITLLKILLVNLGRPVSRDALAEALWPEADPSVTANRVYVLVHALRRAIEPSSRARHWVFVRNDGDRYYFTSQAPFRFDVLEFGGHVETGERLEQGGNLHSAVESYNAALDLYRGDLLEDEPYAEWCWAERENLRETALNVAVKLAAQYASWGALDRSVVQYQRALRLDPLREQNHRSLIETLLAAGRRTEALRQYSLCRELLRRELGVDPMAETQRLYLAASRDGVKV